MIQNWSKASKSGFLKVNYSNVSKSDFEIRFKLKLGKTVFGHSVAVNLFCCQCHTACCHYCMVNILLVFTGPEDKTFAFNITPGPVLTPGEQVTVTLTFTPREYIVE